ncbi:adhesion G protein-coupled receptor E3-like [Leptodactylus fuscus]
MTVNQKSNSWLAVNGGTRDGHHDTRFPSAKCLKMIWAETEVNTVRGVYYLPPEAAHFTQCVPNLPQCPANSSCEEASHNQTVKNFCRCIDGFLNIKEKITFTDVGGECREKCDKGKPFPCACARNSIPKLNANGLYECTDLCKDDSDCPSGASCRNNLGHCYCNEGCRLPIQNNCITLVKLDEVCSDKPSSNEVEITKQVPTTTSPLLTWTTNMRYTTTYTQPGASTPQPVVDKCQTISRYKQEIKDCEKNKDPVCTFLKSIVNITEDACEGNKSKNVQEVADQITDVLNQTPLKKLDFEELKTVVMAVVANVEVSLLATFSANPIDQELDTLEIAAEMKVFHEPCSREFSVNLTVNGNKMEVPCSLVDVEDGGAMLISYKGLNARLNGSILAALGTSHRKDIQIISSMIGGAITSPKTENLSPPVTFTLPHLTAVNPDYNILCVFWDTEEEVWSTHGCERHQSEQENSTSCACTHLSTFAVLMAPTEIEVGEGLRLLSIIGLSISVVCLFLSFLTFILCRSLRSAHSSVLAVLCGCLFLGQLLVLVGLQQTRNKILCSVIAGSLQFLFLCAFCWMTLESILLFLTVRNLRAVNYMNSRRSHFPYICLVGFGIPTIIMIVSVSLYPHIYGEKNYCWIKITHVWTFLGPVCLFICVNFTLLVLTFWLLKKKLASLNSNVSTLNHTRLLTFKALSQLLILGCTWIFGLFQFGSGSVVVSYIFTICNSLQGVYIFLVHCLLNRQVQEEYSKGFRRLCSKKSTSDTTETGSSMPMTSKTSQMSELPKEDTLKRLPKKC